MGIENNECVIATITNTFQQPVIVKEIWTWISELPKDAQGLFVQVESVVNMKTTIFMGPSGSKKGWEDDRIIADIRNQFIELLDKYKYEDDSSPIEYVEVGYGEYGQKVLRGNNKNCYNDNEYAV